ncbi:hypothetical protein MCOR25_010123 [Pyricularia grisea]|nr:hypothetical protein MCOR25_010123 [Pyricularia grisea]
MDTSSCCTCAKLLSVLPHYTKESTPENSEKPPAPLPEHRQLGCCGRTICGSCINNNNRFANYCPYCQISTGPSSLPPAGLKDPPSYGFVTAAASRPPIEAPPPYSTTAEPPAPPEKGKRTGAETPTTTNNKDSPILHFLDHEHDSVSSLSLRYNVPAAALRRANRLGSDHLLLGRRVVLIPVAAGGGHDGGATTTTSLSPHPVEGEEEERRKGRIRRWMVACKEADYDVAVLYLEQNDYDVDAAVEAYFADEAWERAHPVAGRRSKRGSGGWNRLNTPASASSSSTMPARSSSAWPLSSFGLGSWR